MSIAEKFLDLEKKKAPEKKATDATTKEVMTKPEVKKAKDFIRTLGNVSVAAEAQRIYNPNLPPTKPKGPTAAQQEIGTSPSLHADEPGWGTTNA